MLAQDFAHVGSALYIPGVPAFTSRAVLQRDPAATDVGRMTRERREGGGPCLPFFFFRLGLVGVGCLFMLLLAPPLLIHNAFLHIYAQPATQHVRGRYSRADQRQSTPPACPALSACCALRHGGALLNNSPPGAASWNLVKPIHSPSPVGCCEIRSTEVTAGWPAKPPVWNPGQLWTSCLLLSPPACLPCSQSGRGLPSLCPSVRSSFFPSLRPSLSPFCLHPSISPFSFSPFPDRFCLLPACSHISVGP